MKLFLCVLIRGGAVALATAWTAFALSALVILISAHNYYLVVLLAIVGSAIVAFATRALWRAGGWCLTV
jgi:hypothetical protein